MSTMGLRVPCRESLQPLLEESTDFGRNPNPMPVVEFFPEQPENPENQKAMNMQEDTSMSTSCQTMEPTLGPTGGRAVLTKSGNSDVITCIQEGGLLKLGELGMKDYLVTAAFNQETLLTMGHQHEICDWSSAWRQKISAEQKQGLASDSWSTTVVLEAFVVNIRNASLPGPRGLLQPLLKRYHAGGCAISVFSLPAIQAVIHFKWNQWAFRFLLYELLAYAVWLSSFVIFSLLFDGEDWKLSLPQLLSSWRGQATTLCNFISLMAMLPFVHMEGCTIAAYGLGWLNVWNVLDVLTYILQISLSTLYLLRVDLGSDTFSILLATNHLLLWGKLHYFARVFNPAKNLLVETISIVFQDLKWFLLFMVLAMTGFALAFYSLFRQDLDSVPDFTTFWNSFATMFSFLLAMFDLNSLYNSTNPSAAMLLFIIYEYVMNIMLLNVMIAIMASSFNRAMAEEGSRLQFSKAQIIDELESTLPGLFHHSTWYPSFVHVLKVQPGSALDINLGSIWSSLGTMETHLIHEHEETALKLKRVHEGLESANASLDRMISQLANIPLGPSSTHTESKHVESVRISACSHPDRLSSATIEEPPRVSNASAAQAVARFEMSEAAAQSAPLQLLSGITAVAEILGSEGLTVANSGSMRSGGYDWKEAAMQVLAEGEVAPQGGYYSLGFVGGNQMRSRHRPLTELVWGGRPEGGSEGGDEETGSV
ncbi:hypothetical protein CEUSTIGMA_g8970.t1 [Chlamydomonas eustigma]|uniref:Ion transport domain-containing protein n=1 Tax=Chlamydomonas eustigma TaxID=1157962 RepID=A0A250XF54_9CHLO|nr:hypothetical protein CEUSTIGMA_g8970.t1 [Chlamydomonas eustigma]|eukprot:GAX81542.1 hypothetical protein CEUSTIGMA_g8970.t1 [Chlamydomonas eustigma]